MSAIRRAQPADAGEVLTLQRAAFVTEAQLHDDVHMPPLTQTLDEVRAAITDGVVLVAWGGTTGNRIVGSVRAALVDDEWHIGRLVVAPDLQGNRIGTQLLDAIETLAPAAASAYTIETGPKSTRNITLYERRGYHQVPSQTILIRLTKPLEYS